MRMKPVRGRIFVPTVAAGLCSGALSGCAAINNSRLTVGNSAPASFTATSAIVESTEQSVTGLDRSQWQPMNITITSDGTQHRARLTTNGPRYVDDPARNRGIHPTAGTALDVKSHTGVLIAEAVAAPLHAALDVPLSLPRIVIAFLQGGVVASPAESYERAPVIQPPIPEPAIVPIEPGEVGAQQ